MSDITIKGVNSAGEIAVPRTSGSASSSQGFDAVMNEVLGKLDQVQSDADKAVKDVAGGGDVTQAIVEMEKADMNFQLMIEVRNKLISAYEEIMRMQV